MLQAIIFDFDGTILDTERHEYASWLEIYRQHAVDLPLEVWVQVVGTVATDFDPHQLLEEQSGRQFDRPMLHQQRRRRFLDLVENEPLRPGVSELIQAAHDVGLRLGVASSGTRDWVEGHLAARRLRDYFGVVRTSADVRRVKPDPELFLSAAAALGIEPPNTIVIEDSRHGLVAAKAAGMRCLVAPNEVTQFLDFSEADLVVESLASITVNDLYALMRRS
jgi:HAD superfamily hydrolase (TIGR01509 family)